MTYIRLTAPAAGRPCPEGLHIAEAGSAHRSAVRAWMARAVREGAGDHGLQAREDAVRAAVDEVLAEPSLTVFVALLDDRPVGHAVLLADRPDAVTGAGHAELWDVLVEPDAPHAAACRDALVARAAGRTAALGRPLLGHVVHAADEGESRVLASLRTRGWRTDHTYWTATPAGLSSFPPPTSIGTPQ